MAAEQETEEQQEQEESKGSKKMLFIIIGAVVALIAAVAVVFFVFMGGDESSSQQSSDALGVTGPEAGSAYYVALPRPFIFNIPGQQRDRLVQISVQLMVRGTRNEELARQNIPAIEGVLHRTFSSSTAEMLETSEGRTDLRAASLNVVRTELQELTGSPVVEEVLFTGFVMQ
ncbi:MULTISPECIES: flagellar basal body-associated protein FliL [Gammaproteobacteria]|uniref:flagellar basal body-associated protein FliL n=1 Tax=Gammaproteobacteria TaxID=1236 RepID=UPI000DD0712D|nr:MULTISPECIES: flagellar basal body-associated protein FliL [Gammaproteobacteria]RTE85455.1 flagellar basal body-associated protein FliL [Aliidiomarina sp. B3213]TCZ89422.1 flagellar basal body-associated protein FliL [Lysobacter sp. N42]